MTVTTEKAQVRSGLQEPDVRAFVRVVGILRSLPSHRARERVLRYVADKLNDSPPADE